MTDTETTSPSGAVTLSPAELGARIAALRRSRGLSQSDLAARLELSRPLVVGIEKGTRTPRPEELAVISEVLDAPLHALLTGRPYLGTFAPKLRRTGADPMSNEAVDAATTLLREFAEDYLRLEQLLGMDSARAPHLPQYPLGRLGAGEAAEDVADQERSRLGLGNGPIPDVMATLERAGVWAVALPLPEFRLAGLFAYTDRTGPCVLINAAHPPTRQAFTAAHEYGHCITDLYGGEVTVLFDYARKPSDEQFADRFAGAFLMPAAGLRQRFRATVRDRGDYTVADAAGMAEEYGVSLEAMVLRLEHTGCVQRGAWDRLRGAKLPRTRQPRKSVRLPHRFRTMAVQAHERDLISETELMGMLHCSRVEARETVLAFTEPQIVESEGVMQLSLDLGTVLSPAPREHA